MKPHRISTGDRFLIVFCFLALASYVIKTFVPPNEAQASMGMQEAIERITRAVESMDRHMKECGCR